MHSQEIAKPKGEPDGKKDNEDCNEVITIEDHDDVKNNERDESKLIIDDNDDITNDKSDKSKLIIDDDYYIEENLLVIDEEKQNDNDNSLDEQDMIKNKDNQDFRKDVNEDYEAQNASGETD